MSVCFVIHNILRPKILSFQILLSLENIINQKNNNELILNANVNFSLQVTSKNEKLIREAKKYLINYFKKFFELV